MHSKFCEVILIHNVFFGLKKIPPIAANFPLQLRIIYVYMYVGPMPFVKQLFFWMSDNNNNNNNNT